MTNNTDSQLHYDWNNLAQEALDLWEGHLNALSSDPKAKEDMAKFIAPLSEMYTQWANMLQTNFPGASPFTASTQDQPSEERPAAQCEAEDTVYDEWLASYAEMAERAGQATAEFVARQQGLCAAMSTTPVQDEPAKAAVKVDLAETGTPAYAYGSGFSFGTIEDIEPEYAAKTNVTEVSSVEAPIQQDAPAVARSVDMVAPVVVPVADVLHPAAESRSTPVAHGSRDLAELASRLALLERELEGMRKQDSVDDADDAEAQRMARARQTGTSF
jgi:hypothetical protein